MTSTDRTSVMDLTGSKTSPSEKHAANLSFEARRCQAAPLSNNVDAAEYKHLHLCPIFCKCTSEILEVLCARPVAILTRSFDMYCGFRSTWAGLMTRCCRPLAEFGRTPVS
ncbi:MAG: hypothetical protein BWX48_03488 [Verrucomicrobia bacterium ADurb.Bin006]|nr:MAG: hypothetical protein BWX48_03488 [Verrucomicrobia bacterium ADurb.Bin006]